MTEGSRVFGGAALAALYLLDTGAGELRLAETEGGPSARFGLAPGYAPAGPSPVAEAWRAGRPLWLDAAGVAARRDTATEEPSVGVSLGALPLGGDGGSLGCLVVADEVAEGFDDERRAVLEMYAEHVGERLAVDGTPRARRVFGRGADGVRLGRFTLTLSSGRVDADPTLLDLMGLSADDFDSRVETMIARTVPEDLPALTSMVEPPTSASGSRELEFRTRRPNGELRWLHLRCRLLSDEAGRPERVLGVVADASHLRPSANDVSRVQRLSATLATAVTVHDVSEVAVAALRELGADRVALAGWEADRLLVRALDPPEPAAWPETWRSQWPDTPVFPPTSAVGAPLLPTLRAALREGRMSLWPAGADLERELTGVGPGGLAVVPLPADGQAAGVCLVGWEEPHEFGPEERFLLSAAARLVGQALVRARAFDAQHELAAMLQRSLLPRTLPRLPGGVAVARYLPATVGLDVGGDWYDVIQLTDRHVALVIGDVQGHSAAAATIMGQIRTAIRAYAVEGHSPDVVVSHANRLLVGMETDLFATCCYVAMDMEEGGTWFVRAGHLPPLLRDPDGGTHEVEVEGGPPLGIVADADFPMTTVGLAPGTVLTLVTDGLVESSTLHLEDGLRRVRDIMSATDPSDAARLADALIGGADRRDDDVALLLLRYDGTRVRPRRASWALWRLPDAVSHARRFTERTLRAWDVAAGSDLALLVVSELVTNAMVHTQGQVRLDLTLAGDHLRIAVSDSSPRTPVKPTSVDWEATGGRGLLLIEAVTASWGAVPLSGGKQVWGEIDLGELHPSSA
ncbi:PAS sensor protein [Streptomyces sp. 8K308]|uniref:SpoIIE family protein phosphatase n=1 Tax=Streptomyces sp. 8K308 TaxID=2530388 RepID=UPI001043208B|nr:SpoIIE family protein phosphatase [Streptomyces sp. 8K308]TDC27589.1 PAS sensor protein [Streptomyces sp. 8K308]